MTDDGDDSSDSDDDSLTQPDEPELLPAVQKIVNLNFSVDGMAPGKILLRKEYTIALEYLESRAEKFPTLGTFVTGQPGIG